MRDMLLHIRDREQSAVGLDAFMHEYDLSRQEAVMLMCVAVAGGR
jgi:hypothetical protein